MNCEVFNINENNIFQISKLHWYLKIPVYYKTNCIYFLNTKNKIKKCVHTVKYKNINNLNKRVKDNKHYKI